MPARLIAAFVAFAAFGLLLALGHAVGHVADPGWLMPTEASWVNHSTLLAWWLTWLCYPYALVPLCLGLIAIATWRPGWRGRIAFAIVALLFAWRGADLLQHLFARPRRLDWVVKRETAFSFPSSHAAIVAGFYWVLAVQVARSALRTRAIAAAALGLLGLAILWSRLALGAHYLTDLLGGLLWGGAAVAALAACWPRNVFEGRSRPTLE